jgi:hypothetical protein
MEMLLNDDHLLLWGLFTRLLGLVLCINFASVLVQIRALVGAQGLEPARWLFRAVSRDLPLPLRFIRFPSFLLLNESDGFLTLVCGLGLVSSLAIVWGSGAVTPAAFFIAWLCWLSIQVSNPTIFSFPWDLLLSECALFGALLPGLAPFPELGSLGAPQAAVAFYFNWLLFRVVFGMGLTRFKKRGETERDFTYIYHFLQWQPMPTLLAYYLCRLPLWFHRLSFVFLFWTEVVAVFGIFGPPPARAIAFVSIALLQLGIWAAGNYGTFSILTLVLSLPLLAPLPPWREVFLPSGPWNAALVTSVLLAHFILSFPSFLLANFWTGTLWLYHRKALRKTGALRWVLEPVATVLRFFAPFRLLNSYGVFRHQEVYVRHRLVVRLEGSLDGKEWRGYETKFLTSRPDQRPRFFAPYHPRLDHFLFYGLCEKHSLKMFMFMACNPYYFHPFCLTEKLVQKLLRNDLVALSFFRASPFGETPPRQIRYALYRYAFTTPAEKAATGHWWKTECLGVSKSIERVEVADGAGVRGTYDRFISETQSRGLFSTREFVDPRTGVTVPMHVHLVERFRNGRMGGRCAETPGDPSRGQLSPGALRTDGGTPQGKLTDTGFLGIGEGR